MGHLCWVAIAVSMQFLQKTCPHFVVVSSTNGSMQIAHRKLGAAGGMLLLCASAEGMSVSVACNKEFTVSSSKKSGWKMMLIGCLIDVITSKIQVNYIRLRNIRHLLSDITSLGIEP